MNLYVCYPSMSILRSFRTLVLTQVAGLCLRLCHLKDKDTLQCFKGESRKRDSGMKGIKEMKKAREG
jgi:hypothetical protein